MNAAYETAEDRVSRLLVEIGQFKIVDRNHREMCADEIRKRQIEIEIVLGVPKVEKEQEEVQRAS